MSPRRKARRHGNFAGWMRNSIREPLAHFGFATPKLPAMLKTPLFRGEELKQYELDTYVVMPNHVHVLLWPWVPMERITGGIKGVSARDANAALGRTGMHFWEDESFDHWVRNDVELRRIRIYIERNPVTAGLVRKARGLAVVQCGKAK